MINLICCHYFWVLMMLYVPVSLVNGNFRNIQLPWFCPGVFLWRPHICSGTVSRASSMLLSGFTFWNMRNCCFLNQPQQVSKQQTKKTVLSYTQQFTEMRYSWKVKLISTARILCFLTFGFSLWVLTASMLRLTNSTLQP